MGDRRKFFAVIRAQQYHTLARMASDDKTLLNCEYSGHTPLTLAIFLHDEKMVEMLLGLGANSDLTDSTGIPPVALGILSANKNIADLFNRNK